jgi:transposase-like protein
MKPTLRTEETETGHESRRRRSAEQRNEYLELFEKSGLSAVAFCREQGLCKQTLYNWRHRFRRARGAVPAPPRFAEVAVTTASTNAGAICVHLAGDVSVEASVGTDAAWLARVVHELRILR